jgi:hypothetical protein
MAGLGKLRFQTNRFQFFTVTGGPYYERPDTMVGVKMAKEIRRPCDIDIPTADFQVPKPVDLRAGLERAVASMLSGEPLYVGCAGGKGRTGLFLAVLAKAWGIENPVEFVRTHYYEHAVETTEQYDYVVNFQIPTHIKEDIAQAKRWSWWKFWRRNMTHATSHRKAIHEAAIARL